MGQKRLAESQKQIFEKENMSCVKNNFYMFL